VRVVIADDHELLRKGLGAIFSGEPGWTVCGEAANGQEAVELVVQLRPDLVLLDITMPRMNGLAAAAKIRQLAPATKILIVSMHDSPVAAREALKAGADGFLPKSAGGFHLMRAIDAIFRNGAPAAQPDA
jgi:DNA-binding NarL/FixJ family response regulator